MTPHYFEAIVELCDLNIWRTWRQPYNKEEILQLIDVLQTLLEAAAERGEGWLDRHLVTLSYYQGYPYEELRPNGKLCDCDICERYKVPFERELQLRRTQKLCEREARQLRKLPKGTALRIFERDHYTCVKCGGQHIPTIDHIIPFSKGGTHEDSNLRTLCRSCNASKRDRIE